jgi:hypothetical protein
LTANGHLDYLCGNTEGWTMIINLIHPSSLLFMRAWRNGSASASQAEGCRFDPGRPLFNLKHFIRVALKPPVLL